MAADRAGDGKMHLYLPMNHPQLPWTGVFTGLMAMHCFYWGTNQFIVQRAIAARSDTEARIGIIVAGFLKLLIPFFAIATGVAAFYLFKERLNRDIAPDTAFTEVVRLVVPAGFGIVGLISAGLIGAILSSIDSMMNSAATIVTIDIYKRYINPNASDRQMIRVGRLSIIGFVVLAALMAIFIIDPNSKQNFFLQIVNYQNYLTPGLLVAFVLGMLWRRGTATAAFVTIISGVFFSWLVEYIYNHHLGGIPMVAELFGERLNFFHRVVGVILLCAVIHVTVSLLTPKNEEKGRLVWTDLGGHEPGTLRNLFLAIIGSVLFFVALAFIMVAGTNPTICAAVGSLWTLAMFAGAIKLYPRKDPTKWFSDDRSWAGLLCSLAIFMMFYFY